MATNVGQTQMQEGGGETSKKEYPDPSQVMWVNLMTMLVVTVISIYIFMAPTDRVVAAGIWITLFSSTLHQLVQIPLMPFPRERYDWETRAIVLVTNIVLVAAGIGVLYYMENNAHLDAGRVVFFIGNILVIGAQGVICSASKWLSDATS